MYSGAVHYWRLQRDAWRPALQSIKAMGLRIVETYAPWGVHEAGPGEYDFGDTDPRKDLGAFLDMIAEEGLWAFIRPGPHINAELTHFGLPERVVYDPRCQARSPEQNPVVLFFPPKMFPVPSCASEAYFDEVERWYQRVGSVVSPRIYPEGPVILLQVDNEGTLYFRDSVYDQDYHVDATVRFPAFIKRRYGTLKKASRAHNRDYADWPDIEPPTQFDADEPRALPRHLDWARFQEHLITTALARLRDMMASAGMSGTPVLHNLPPGDIAAPMHIPDLQREVGLVGLDYYHRARDYETIKRRTLYLAGTVPFPYSPELGAGVPAWFTPSTEADSLFCAQVACAHGLRGFNLYMGVGRDRWVGAPIDSRGRPRPIMESWKRLVELLTRIRFPHLRRDVEVAIVIPRDYARLSRVTHLFGPLSPTLIEMLTGRVFETSRDGRLGFEHSIQRQWWKTTDHLARALTSAKVPYCYLDSEADVAQWEGYRLLCCPTFDFINTHTWHRLMDAAQGGTHIIHGPAVPGLDAQMRRAAFEALPHALCAQLTSEDHARRAVERVVAQLELPRPYAASPASIETCVHHDGENDVVLFVIQPDDHDTAAELTLPKPLRLTDVISGETFEASKTLTLPMTARSCRVLEIEPDGPPASELVS